MFARCKISSESVSEQSLRLIPDNEETELALVQSLKLTLQEASLELSQSVNIINSSSVVSALSCCITLSSPAVIIQGAFAHAQNEQKVLPAAHSLHKLVLRAGRRMAVTTSWHKKVGDASRIYLMKGEEKMKAETTQL